MPAHRIPPLCQLTLRTAILLAAALIAIRPAHAQIQTHTVTTLSTTAARFPYGSPITLTVALTPASAAGSVTLTDNAQPLATLSLASGTAVYTSATFAPGLHTFAATYPGDPADAASASPTLPITVDLDATTLTLSAEPALAPWSTLPPLTVIVHPAGTGNITLTDTASPGTPATAPLVGGTSTFDLSTLKPGLHTLTATYPGDPHDLGATSPAISVIVTPTPAIVSLQIGPSPSTWSQPVTFSAHVTPATGSVSFTDTLNGPLGQASINPAGFASLITSTLSVGLHTITASLPADATHTLTTDTQPLLVAPDPTNTILTPIPPEIPTGFAITLTATVAPSSATGVISFRDTSVGTLGQAAAANGTASLTLPSLNPGLHTITAAYAGSATMAPSISVPVSTSVTSDNTILNLSISPTNPLTAQPVTLTVTSQPASLTGLITYADGPNLIGQTLLLNGSATLTTANLATGPHTLRATIAVDPTHVAATSTPQLLSIAQDPTTLTVTLAQNPIQADVPITVNLHLTAPYGTPTGTLTLRTSSSTLAFTSTGNSTLTFPGTLAPGTYALTASYSGDANNLPTDTAANPALLTINEIPTTGTLALSASSVFPNTAVTLTATVSTTTPTLIPNGAVQFLRNGYPIASATLKQGTASTSIPSLPLGTSTFLAQYQPTSPFAPVTLGPASLNVAQPFALTLNPAALTITPTTLQPISQASTLTLTPFAGFTGSITLTCASPETFLTCTASPASATLTSIAADSTLTLTATPVSLAQTRNRPRNPRTPLIALAALTLLFPLRRLRQIEQALPAALLACVCLTLTSCGWGGSLNILPSGTYSVSITASGGGITIPATLSVTILPTH